MNESEIIKEYKSGKSMTAIATKYGTYPATVKRILEKCDVELRHDFKAKGEFYVKNGEELIAWAKAQGRLVSKAELAEQAGTKRLSPSYFLKYPELGKYVKTRGQSEIKDYYIKLYTWLNENSIPYKPNDRTKLGVSLDALLLGDYKGLALQIAKKPSNVSQKYYEDTAFTRSRRASAARIVVIYLDEEHFKDLNSILGLLDSLKEVRK